MSFTYDLTTDLGKMRLSIGDTISTEVFLQDDEINTILTLYGVNAEAQLQCLYAIRARWTRDFDRSNIGLSSSRSQRMTHIKDAITSLEGVRNRRARCYLSGVSISERTSNRQDTDKIKPAFTRTRFDNPGANTDDDGTGIT